MLSRILFGLRATLGMGVIAVAVGGGLGAADRPAAPPTSNASTRL